MGFILKIKTYFLSFIINLFNGDNYHNTAKFYSIYKIWNNIKLDDVDGDYIEFGILKGKSLLHSVKTYNKLFPRDREINFFGIDSFEGFPTENHNFYKNKNFLASYDDVKKTFAKYKNIKIIKGFFGDVLESDQFKEKKYSFVFLDCDIYESSVDVFKYIRDKVSLGGFLMIDDFTSIDKNKNSIYKAFNENIDTEDFVYFDSYSNGQIFRRINL